MTSSHGDIIRHHSRPLHPNATAIPPKLEPLPGIRAVLFDVYGTLLISTSGDIGTAIATVQSEAVSAALAHAKIDVAVDATTVVERLMSVIQSAHRALKEDGILYPEVEIRQIWTSTLEQFGVQAPTAATVERIAIEYEMMVNPVWPMPGARPCLEALRQSGRALGLVSNAQFYTPIVLETLLGETLTSLGITGDARHYSFEHLRAKPEPYLYELASEALSRRNVSNDEVLYVGNDMLKDIAPASRVGFRTALFAGDARSLRLRESDDRVAGVEPDLIIHNLMDITECLPR